MNMRTIKVGIYNYDELSNKAKAKALHEWCDSEYLPSEENEKTLNVFETIFPIKVDTWYYSGCGSHISFTFLESDEIEEMTGVRLATYIYNNYYNQLFKGKYYSLWSKKEKSLNNPNIGKLKQRYSKVTFETSCVLTGYYMDESILKPIYDFLKKPCKHTTFKELMYECLNGWLLACEKDMQTYYSEGNFIEICEINEWEFFVDGRIAV
ncbi:hypothetical protein SUNDANCE_189 [Brevibacillus phage Sundance]|uniref:hypothetical protein n=2 Tax=root TaxID=1 RepID=UPI0006BE02A6|nr:hypothetical protein AVT09_gp189 [Brevibacillus phage Sundance]ALA48005.1 hypothetical protein SUNDANCE_189 [Brevibacillus phage Sundance]